MRRPAAGDAALEFSAETFLWVLQTCCDMYRVPWSVDIVAAEYPPPQRGHHLLQALRGHGFACRWRWVRGERLAGLPLPCFVAAARETGQDLRLLVGIDGGEAIVRERGRTQTCRMPLADLGDGARLRVLIVEAPGQDGGVAARPFGFAWFVPELLRHRAVWRDILLASLALQLLALAWPLFTQVMIDKVVVHRTTDTLIVIGSGLALCALFGAVLGWVRQYLVLHTGNRIEATLGAQVFEHLLGLPLRYFEHRPTGTVLARVQGVDVVREFLSGAAVTLVLDVPFILIFLGVMLYYSVLLSVIALVLLGLIVALSMAMTPLLRRRLDRQYRRAARSQAFLAEYLAGMETVKALQMEPQLRNRYGDHLAGFLHAHLGVRQLSNTWHTLAQLLDQTSTLTILCLGAWLVMDGADFTVGMLVAFQMFASRLSQPVLRLVDLWQQFQQARIAVERLSDVMNAPREPHSLVPARLPAGRGRIEIRRLGFRHGDHLPYLYRDLSFVVEPGRCVALMGASGCGKSTLVRLAQGFCQPTEGAILLDGQDIRHLAANELRSRLGVVPQHTVLFAGTIYENLILADPRADFARVVQACRLAEIHETIEQLPAGYRTRLGERGAGLSGGQRQRIAIARALLKRPQTLVLDEAASGLDTDTAERLAATISLLRNAMGVLFIAHRLPRNLQVDQVVLLGACPGSATRAARAGVEMAAS